MLGGTSKKKDLAPGNAMHLERPATRNLEREVPLVWAVNSGGPQNGIQKSAKYSEMVSLT